MPVDIRNVANITTPDSILHRGMLGQRLARVRAPRVGAASARGSGANHPRARVSKLFVRSVLVSLVGTVFTLVLVASERGLDQEVGRLELERRADVATGQLEVELARNTDLLSGLQALYNSSSPVDRAEFAAYVAALDVSNRFSDTQAIEWAPVIQTADQSDFERRVQGDTDLDAGGYPGFSIHPTTSHDDMFVVEFVEPLLGNEAAFGFDLGSSDARRASVELARDTGQPVATAPITLVQETGSQQGFLLMMPIYEDISVSTVDARRESFAGVVLAVFRAGDLIHGAMESDQALGFRVDDAVAVIEGSDASIASSASPQSSSTTTVRSVDVGDRSWELTFWARESLHASTSRVVVAITILGLVVSIMAGLFVHILGTRRDRAIELADRLTKDLKATNETLARSNHALEEFAYVASHDLQTPVRNVTTSVLLLTDALGDDPEPEVLEYMGFLTAAASRMRALIDGLLDFSRTGYEDLTWMPVDLAELLNDVLEMLRSEISESSATVRFDQLPTVCGDPVQLGRVFSNLIGNAIKYRADDRDPVIVVGYEPMDSGIKVTVADNGMGVADEFHESVFAMFRRLHRHEDISGSGIGLGVCRRIVERHGGKIMIESSSSEGTTVAFTLPNQQSASET